MDLNLKNKNFLVCGATSGFGRAIAEALLLEGAKVIAIARSEEGLKKFQDENSGELEIFAGDISNLTTLADLKYQVNYMNLSGAVINAGGPPAKSFMETNISDWDKAYEQLVRWKVKLSQDLIPYFQKNGFGRLLYIESASVKQTIDNLVLSNSLRMAVVGFVKSLAVDFASSHLTFNVLAPGYHKTQAIDRILDKVSDLKGISRDEAKNDILQKLPSGKMGSPDDLASLACWLLSDKSGYINGQTISVDGGLVRGNFG